MHTKSSNSTSPSKDPVSLKRSKQANPKQSESAMSVDLPTTAASNNNNNNNEECFWNIVKASNHPVVLTKINRMRRQDTDSKLFRELMYEVGTFLAYEATSDLSLTEAKTVKAHHEILFYFIVFLGSRFQWTF